MNIKELFVKFSFNAIDFNKEIRKYKKKGLLGCKRELASRLFRAELADAWDSGAEETVNWCSNNWDGRGGWGDPPGNPYMSKWERNKVRNNKEGDIWVEKLNRY